MGAVERSSGEGVATWCTKGVAFGGLYPISSRVIPDSLQQDGNEDLFLKFYCFIYMLLCV